MTAYDQESLQVEERRWLLRMPAHHVDVDQALLAAYKDWGRQAIGSCSEVMVTAEDENLVIKYTIRTPGTFIPRAVGTASSTPPKEFLVQETNDAWKP